MKKPRVRGARRSAPRLVIPNDFKAGYIRLKDDPWTYQEALAEYIERFDSLNNLKPLEPVPCQTLPL